jgi:hypothetical protein
MVKVTLVRAVTIRADANVFPTTLVLGGGGRRKEKGTLSPQKSKVHGG